MLFNESPDDSGYPRQAFIQVKNGGGQDSRCSTDQRARRQQATRATTRRPRRRSTRLTSGSPAARSTWATRRPPSTTRTAFTDASKTRYRSPGLGCARNHIIYLANGSPQTTTTSALELLQRLNPEGRALQHSGRGERQDPDEANWIDEFAAFLQRRRGSRQRDRRRAEHHDAHDRRDRRLERRQLSELHPLDRQAGRRLVPAGAATATRSSSRSPES